jgi:trehalose synthase-fused probable maltokinase
MTMRTLEVTGGWETIFAGEACEALEGMVLPPFLQAQRWFGGKARRLAAVRLVDWAELPAGACRAFLALFEVSFGDSGTDLYFLPLGVTAGAQQDDALATLRGPGGEAVLQDALANDDVCAALLGAAGHSQQFPTQAGFIRACPTSAFTELRGPAEVHLTVSRPPATSSNSLVRYDRRLLLKLFRRLEVGVNPDFEIGRFLTEETTFDRIPRVGGAIEYHRPGSGPITLAIVQAFIPNQGDGWEHALDELSRYFARVAGRLPAPAPDGRPLLELAATEPPPDAGEAIGLFLQHAATLGRRTGELHRALAGNVHDPAFAPEPLTATDLQALGAGLRAQRTQAVAGVREHLAQLPEDLVPAAQQFLEEGPSLLTREPEIPPGSWKIRCHGDYHLGQVLWADSDFVILDFEGEPTRTVEGRRAKQSPLKDVAGMVRSFDYAAHAGLFAFGPPGRMAARLEAWAGFWQCWTAAAFLRAYLTVVGPPLVQTGPESFAALLALFMLDKACYELVYELNNRPDWVRIPLRGILSLLDREWRTSGPR